MQTSFYASGFLYSLKTHQILLLEVSQANNLSSSWSTLEGDGIEDEEATITFQRIISNKVNINLKTKDIYPIYDYFQNIKKKLNFVFYAEIANIKAFNKLKKSNLSWFSFQETGKLHINSQAKQDIVVGERVINAKWRDDEARRNPETF